jgi:uracil-DNA glycosylase
VSHESEGATEFLPAKKTLPTLRQAVQDCRGCDLYRYATQAVAGEGPASSVIVFIGEQPGDEEDHQGHPFVGPAGRLFDRALEEAGIDRSGVYVTNAVKHFKFEERGKRRIHKKPSASEARACQPWLKAEIAAIKPEIIVCLGATAAQSVFGPEYRVTKERGKFVQHPWAPHATSTMHPSAILRAPDEQRATEYQLLVDDLRKVKKLADKLR